MKLLCTNGLRSVIRDTAPWFERATGTQLNASFASTNQLLEQIKCGAAGDLAILTDAAIDHLIAQGKLVAGSRVDLARSAIGVAVREGAATPDVGSIAALTDALVAAKSVAHSKTGVSGLYAPILLERLGIADKVKCVVPDPMTVGEAVAGGDADLAVQQVSELMEVPGIKVVGPLPDAVQKITVMAAGMFTSATEPKSARVLVELLRSNVVRPLYAAKGLEAAI
jgi:molybdate transport system substrate-binding protein